jgi:MSHA biogenesis protein MshJ
MDDIKARLKVYADRIDAMSVRERGLIFFAVVVVLYLVAYSVVFAPLRTEQTRLEKQLRDKLAQAQQADQQVAALFSADGKDINAENRSKLAALSEQVRELDAKMDQMTAGVVPPKEMAKLVEQMLMRNKNLELVKLEALPSKPLDDAKTAADKPAPGVTVYRHGMRVEFKGRYFDIVNYLKSLEGLPWKVYWGEVSLETDKYPVSKVSLVIYTLSRYPGWIGV